MKPPFRPEYYWHRPHAKEAHITSYFAQLSEAQRWCPETRADYERWLVTEFRIVLLGGCPTVSRATLNALVEANQ